MNISKDDLTWAVTKNLLSSQQAEALWDKLNERAGTQSAFNIATVAYYAGALVVMAALGWLMTLGWESLGGRGIFFYLSSLLFVFYFNRTAIVAQKRLSNGWRPICCSGCLCCSSHDLWSRKMGRLMACVGCRGRAGSLSTIF